jgi:ankyrin repeat protein
MAEKAKINSKATSDEKEGMLSTSNNAQSASVSSNQYSVTSYINQNKHKSALLLICEGKLPVDSILNKSNKFTLLHYACYYNKINIIQALIEKLKPSINAKDASQQTPLHIATSYSTVRIIKEIASQPSCKFEEKDVYASSPLFNTVKANKLYGFLYLYFEKSADPNVVDSFGCTITHWAAFNNNVSFLSLFKSLGILSIDAKDKAGNTPIFRAVQNISPSATKFLMKEKASLGEINSDNKNPVQYAGSMSKCKSIKKIIEKEEAARFLHNHGPGISTFTNFMTMFSEKGLLWRISAFMVYMCHIYKGCLFTIKMLFYELLLMILFFEYFDQTAFSKILIFLITSMSLLSKFFLIKCISKDPGYKKRLTVNDGNNALPHILDRIKEDEDIPADSDVCFYCLILNGQDDNHCKKCNRCVNGLELHIPLIDKCVGSSNIAEYGMWIMLSFASYAIMTIYIYFSFYAKTQMKGMILRTSEMWINVITHQPLFILQYLISLHYTLTLLGWIWKMLCAFAKGTTIYNITRLNKKRSFLHQVDSARGLTLTVNQIGWRQTLSNIWEGLGKVFVNSLKKKRAFIKYEQLEVTVDKEETKIE